MDAAPVPRDRTTRRLAWWSVAALAVVGLVGAAPGPAAGARTLHLDLRAPATVTAGVPFDVTVVAHARHGRTGASYLGTVRFATDDPLVRALPARYTFTPADRGTHTFTGVTLVGPGRHALAVRDVHARRLHDVDRVAVANANAAVEGQLLSEFDPVSGGTVTVYDAVTGLAVGSGPADIEGYYYRITGLPAGDVKLGAVVPGPYAPDFANDRDTLEQADVFTLQPGTTLVQSWEPDTFGPYLDVDYLG
ncbi:hypothetical protein [Cellulomonas alba]|uniref:DUF4397 domain-containing protein n=1 Tax=Cellulomonas alba TaxID=3053467 RepID=A0ABT7SIX9_9CELL|nr:hypothetical protein [Cellulomonas alba]MDM7855994.1 hypothetical protein [Cellulomonas alba]